MPFPKQIVLNRPRDEYSVVMTVVKMDINKGVTRDKFALEQPEGTQLRTSTAEGLSPAAQPRRPEACPSQRRGSVTYKIVRENMLFKPMRSLLSVLLIGVPVTLILCLVGVSQGLLEDSARRTRGIGADIVVRPPNTSVLSMSGAPMSWKYVETLAKVPHVTVATGTIMQPLANSLTLVGGVDRAHVL